MQTIEDERRRKQLIKYEENSNQQKIQEEKINRRKKVQ